ncbi:unnamed protein product [Somion occarium]|uniref:Uncharacterized protein n=1 Tax=Somion occarium TaxID=3059160 RepID=A0ABP1CZ55_9APHY
MSSELLNALNPNAVHSRPRARTTYPSRSRYTCQAPVEQVQVYVPHRSELEGAIVEPPPPPTQPPVQVIPQQAPAQPDQFTQILHLLTESKQAAQREQERRRQWEREQEARYSQREAEIEKQVTTMKEEISSLKEYISIQSSRTSPSFSSGVNTPGSYYHSIMPTLEQAYVPPPDSPFSPSSQSPYPASPMFVQGSSRQPIMAPQSMPVTPVAVLSPPPIMTHAASTPLPPTPSIASEPPPISSDISTSPTVSVPPTPANNLVVPSPSVYPTPNPRKRPPPVANGESDRDDTGSERPRSIGVDRPAKRINGHDSRCLTIHAAMRTRILRAMGLKSDKNLPDSHVEGRPIADSDPIRFVWERTAKQSPHNAEMKIRVLKDLKNNRHLYKDVPDADFEDKVIQASFDQVFSTFRSKFRAQRDAALAGLVKLREDTKALKSRRVKRKKTKLMSRTEMRGKLETFSHATFDPALQPECMSSEESCEEYSEPSGSGGGRTKVQVLRVRGLPWRSSRLLRFYTILDESQKLEGTGTGTKPKRVPSRKERCLGPPKDEFQLPPKNIASWMLSRRWLKELRIEQPATADAMKHYIVDPPGFDWDKFDMLGVETEEESEPEQYIPRSDTSYALAHALAPPDGAN